MIVAVAKNVELQLKLLLCTRYCCTNTMEASGTLAATLASAVQLLQCYIVCNTATDVLVIFPEILNLTFIIVL